MAFCGIAVLFTAIVSGLLFVESDARKLHHIDLKYPQLFPSRFDWDKVNQHFIVGSSVSGALFTVSDAGIIEDFVTDRDYAGQTSVTGIKVDLRRKRVLALIHNPNPNTNTLSAASYLAAYDLKTAERILYVGLDKIQAKNGAKIVGSDVSADPYGNVYVTDSANNIVLKIPADVGAHPQIFSSSAVLSSEPARTEDPLIKSTGLSGIVYNGKGNFLVTQCNTGLIFKVDMGDGVPRLVQTSKPLLGATRIAMRKDGVALVVSYHTAWYLKSPDNWSIASIVDEIPLNSSMFATDIAVREQEKAYVLNSFYLDSVNGIARQDFSIQEIEFPKDVEGEKTWVIVLIVFGLLYFCIWRFQMRHFVKNLNKKRA